MNDLKLPPLVNREHDPVWFTAQQMTALQRNGRRPGFSWRGLLVGICIGLCSLPLLVGHQGFSVVGAAIAVWLAIMLPILLIGLPMGILICVKAIGYVESGSYSKALAFCDRTSPIMHRLGMRGVSDIVLQQVRVMALLRQGRIVEAQIAYAKWVGNGAPESLTENTLANILSDFGAYDRAADLFMRRYTQCETQPTFDISKQIATANMGWIMLLLGRNEESKKYSEAALKLGTKIGLGKSVEMLANVIVNIARANIQLGMTDEAEIQLNQALDSMNKDRPRSLNRAVGEIQLGFAELRFVQNRIDESLLHAQSAFEFFQSLGRGYILSQYAVDLQSEILHRLGRSAEAQTLKENFDTEEAELRALNETLFLETETTLAIAQSKSLTG